MTNLNKAIALALLLAAIILSTEVSAEPVQDSKEQLVKARIGIMAISVNRTLESCKMGAYIFCEMAHKQATQFSTLLDQYEFTDPDIIEDKRQINEALVYSAEEMEAFKAALKNKQTAQTTKQESPAQQNGQTEQSIWGTEENGESENFWGVEDSESNSGKDFWNY